MAPAIARVVAALEQAVTNPASAPVAAAMKALAWRCRSSISTKWGAMAAAAAMASRFMIEEPSAVMVPATLMIRRRPACRRRASSITAPFPAYPAFRYRLWSLRPQPEIVALREDLAAVDDNGRPGDEVGLVRGKEQKGVGDVAGRAHAPDRDRLFHGADEGGAAVRLHALGQDVARLHAV